MNGEKQVTIITIKPDGSLVVTERKNINSYPDQSATAVMGQLWSYRKKQ